MKMGRPVLALIAVLSIAATSPAQGGRTRGGTPANPQALIALQQDLVGAIESMKAALPIYDGNRVRAIHAAHAALLIVDNAIAGKNAAVRPTPTVKDHGASKQAHTQYTAEQISASQASMEKGYAALKQAWADLKAAAGSNPNQQGKRAANHLTLAGNEARKAIALHSTVNP